MATPYTEHGRQMLARRVNSSRLALFAFYECMNGDKVFCIDPPMAVREMIAALGHYCDECGLNIRDLAPQAIDLYLHQFNNPDSKV